MQYHYSRSSISQRAPSPLVRHHSSSSSSGGNASAAESFTSYTHMAGHFRQPSPGIPLQLASNYSVVSLRSTSRPSLADSIHNAPGALSLRLTRKNSSITSGLMLADSLHAPSPAAGQVQRVDVKRLMSKPRAVLPPSSISTHSILSMPAYPASPKTRARASSSLSDEETADRKATIPPLNVGRRRRSRTLDELMLTTAISMPIRPPLATQITDSTSTPTTPTIPTTPTTPTIPTPSGTLRPNQAAGPSFTTGETTTTALKSPATTAPARPRPKEAINTTAASTGYHRQRTTVWLDNPTPATVPPPRQAVSLDLHRTGDLTPASALVLAWNESQRIQPQPSPVFPHRSPPLPSPGKSPSLPPFQDSSDADIRSYGSYGHATPGSVFDSSTRGAKVVAVGGPEEDPLRIWAMVEEKLRQTPRTPSGGGNPIKGFRRRVTGRFSRGKDKSKEKGKEREKRSESMGALPPSGVYPATSSRPAMPQRQKTEQGLERQHVEDVVIPHPRGSSLTARSSTKGSPKSTTNSSNPTVPESESYRSQITPTRSTMDTNHPGYAYPPPPSVPHSESSQTPANSVRVRSKSPAPPHSASDPGEGDAGRLWKLVRKLSNGALRQRFANEQGDLSVSSENVPPVPALPKDFDMVDHRAYISEWNREHAQEKPPWDGQQRVASLGAVENPRSSEAQSTLTMQSPLALPTSPPSTSQGSPPPSAMSKLYAQHVAVNINTLSPRPYPPRGKHGNKMTAHKPSSPTTSGNSASMSGNEFSFRSTSPGFSSSVASDMMSSKVMTSPYSQPSSASSSSELRSTAVAVARPIVPPEELLRIRHEDSLARQRPQSDTGHGGASSGRVQPRGPRIHIKHSNKSSVVNNRMLSSPVSPPPPSSSPVSAHPLPAPPRRQTLGNAPLARARARHGDRSAGPTGQASLRAKSLHDPPIPRSLSSPPGSPRIPSFANDRPANMFDDHRHTRSTSLRNSGSFAPLSSSSSAGDSLSPKSRFGSLSSINALSPPPVRRRVAKTNRPMHVASPIARHIEGNISILSRNSFGVMDDHYIGAELEGTVEKGKRPRLNTSNSLLDKVRSRGVKSSSALQNPESSGTDPSPMTSKTAPARLGCKGRQRGRSKSYVEVGRVPFTATAFAFRDLNPGSPVSKPTLTEKEREDRWAALLARSDRAGGTLTARLEGGVLLSDTMSITED